MKFTAFIVGFLRIVLLGIGLIFIIGRLFFPKQIESSVITPVRRMPVFGQVLGVTWDRAGQAGAAVTDKTIGIINTIENTDLPLNESILKIAQNNDPKQAASDAVNQQIDKEVANLKNLPQETINQMKEELRKEMYKQICKQWLEDKPATNSSGLQ